MWELYWLTRVESIGVVLRIVLFISVAATMGLGGVYLCERDWDVLEGSEKYFRISLITLIISLLLIVFIPRKQDMLLIYGLGPTIDYIQDNEKVKELPDKCVEALSKWVDSLNEDK